jgi:hypothetical protein
MTASTLDIRQAQEDRFGRGLAARLNAGTETLPHDVSERLKVARMQALAKRNVVKVQASAVVVGMSGGAATLGGPEHPGLWGWLGSLVPLLALVAGLITIGVVQDGMRANEIAEVDAELLTDVLPPAAYTDPGFAQYLRSLKED